MSLRQDSDPYCMLFLGLIILTAFIFNFIYLGFLMPAASLVIAGSFTLIGGMSILLVFFLIGYFRPEKGKGKNLMMALSVLVGFFFVVFIDQFVMALPSVGTTLYLSCWGLGGSIITAAGFSMMHNREESYSPGILDTSALHYGPEPEPEPEVEEEVEPEVESAGEEETTEPTVEETTEASSEPVPDAETE
ncbi:MAG: hypothetical protein KGD60_01200 [Candidatus Thorarchaeota archaeon]|nr:hypothetical protein [Candidatus Thorarchaeota archaeon]